eukprot:ctg_129.g84
MAAKNKIAILGSGNWGSTVARIAGGNAARHSNLFDAEVRIWVYEEVVNGRKLTEIINTEHENVKYLPGKKLPENVVACPEPEEAAAGANILIFVLPHQFVKGLCAKLVGHLRKDAFAVSLIKGVDFDEGGVVLISEVIRKQLGVPCAVLMGANVANEIAEEQFSEATIGYRDEQHAQLLKHVFQTHYFRIAGAPDVAGVEICGALKNIVALAAGFCDGMGLGNNTKAAVIRLGLVEMIRFAKHYLENVRDATFLQSCGVADLITTCYGGRNRRCAEVFARSQGAKTFEDIEQEVLNGQKLQGTLTAKDVHAIIKRDGLLERFRLFTSVYEIAFCGKPVASLLEDLGKQELNMNGDIS